MNALLIGVGNHPIERFCAVGGGPNNGGGFQAGVVRGVINRGRFNALVFGEYRVANIGNALEGALVQNTIADHSVLRRGNSRNQ